MITVPHRSNLHWLFFATALTAAVLAPTSSIAQVNTATGQGALHSITTGVDNTADGYDTLYSDTTGNLNTATGDNALQNNTTGSYNTAQGCLALYYNTIGCYNTVNGFQALISNTTGSYNTATGSFALYSNQTADSNAATGYNSMYTNTTGYYNTANGCLALYSNTTGYSNVAIGHSASFNSTTGLFNSTLGSGALYSNRTGGGNTACGFQALYNATGASNIALGCNAGSSITSGSNNIDIGNFGAAGDSGILRIGSDDQSQAYIGGITGVGVTGAAVYVNTNGQLGILKSSQRFKFDIHSIGASSDKLMDLRPVTFRYREAAEDGTHPLQYGLIAEEVAKVYPDLVQYDKQGKPFTIYYHLLTPMMLNELQKAHQEIAALKAGQSTTAALQTQVTSLQHTNQLQFMVFTAFVLVLAAFAIAGRAKRTPSSREYPNDNGASLPVSA